MYVKYPRTPHLPWSLGMSSDDEIINSVGWFQGKSIVCTEKRDGECSSLYADGYVHARSINSGGHEWQSWLKRFWQERFFDLPQGWRICGENLYARHSIDYTLNTYFEGFSIWNEENCCLAWSETLQWFDLLGIQPVPVLYEGVFDDSVLKQLASSLDPERCEGYVVRFTGAFHYQDFTSNVSKFVRANHVQTDQHWTREWIPNQLITRF